MAVAGKIMPRPMGDYDTSTVYEVLDIVSHNERPWICRKPNTVGVEPSDDNSEYWMLLINVDITNADTLDGHDSLYFASRDDLKHSFTPIQVVFQASGWSEEAPYTQTVEVSQFKETDSPFPSFVDDGETKDDTKAKQKAYGCISYYDSGNGTVTAICKYEKPEEDVTVEFKGVSLLDEILS